MKSQAKIIEELVHEHHIAVKVEDEVSFLYGIIL